MDQEIIRFLERDELRCVAAREMYKQEGAKVLAFTGRALLMETRGIHALSADSGEEALRACEQIEAMPLLMCDCAAAVPLLKSRYGFQKGHACYNVVYKKKEPVKVREDARLALIGEKDAERVVESYKLEPPELVRRQIKEGALLGGYVQDEWVGYIGIHDEGSIGMLYIFPSARRRGLGFTLEGMMINRRLEQGRLPWAQIITDNHASLALQKKLGMVRSKDTVVWLS